ncbi:MAG: phosphatidylserine decarboxylase, partial [Acidobacteriota bacterium]
MPSRIHQYIDRNSGKVRTERLLADRLIKLLYSNVRENAPFIFKVLTSGRASSILGYLNFDTFLGSKSRSSFDLIHHWGLDVSEFLEEPEKLDTPYKLFCRKIRYWDCRPMSQDARVVVAPADSRVLLGSFKENSLLFIKNKFFDFSELFGADHGRWLEAFQEGRFATFRLTPDKYHYTHTSVAGRV